MPQTSVLQIEEVKTNIHEVELAHSFPLDEWNKNELAAVIKSCAQELILMLRLIMRGQCFKCHPL